MKMCRGTVGPPEGLLGTQGLGLSPGAVLSEEGGRGGPGGLAGGHRRPGLPGACSPCDAVLHAEWLWQQGARPQKVVMSPASGQSRLSQFGEASCRSEASPTGPAGSCERGADVWVTGAGAAEEGALQPARGPPPSLRGAEADRRPRWLTW